MSTAVFKGSCICSAVTYEIVGTPAGFYHCHCGRCRKASGTGHASNIIIRNPESAQWTAGEDLLGSFKVPNAERFRTVFCTRCGSPLPRVAVDMSMAVIPAGSLDTEPPLTASDRIMWDSRAAWSCDGTVLATWPTYPK